MCIRYVSIADNCGLVCCRIIHPNSHMVRLFFMLVPSCIAFSAFFALSRLARGSILASVIRIIPGGPLKAGALYVSGLFMVLYAATIAQLGWACHNLDLDSAG
jgi:hypothetical protein